MQLDPPSPSPQPILISTTPFIYPVSKTLLQLCSIENQPVNLVLDIQSYPLESIDTVDIAITLGEPEAWDGITAFQLGWEDIYIIGSLDTAFKIKSMESIQEQFTASPGVHYIWTYPQDHPLRKIFDDVIFGKRKITPYALVAPNPGEMLDAVSRDSNSIGYIPGSWMTDNVKIINIQEAFRRPILALRSHNADKNIQKYIACLQQNWTQK